MNCIKVLLTVLIFVPTSFLLAQNEEGCTDAGCHNDLLLSNNIHPAMEDDCFNCHEGDLTKHPVTKGNEFILVDKMPDLCFACHDDFGGENLKLHSPVMMGNCNSCHSPHGSNEPSLLLEDDISTCLNCHNNDIRLEDRTIINIAKKIKNEDLAHAPVLDDCITCHKPHASKYSFLLNDSFPLGNYASGFDGNYSLCFTCHDEEAFTRELTNEETEFRNGSTNLHFVHVNKEKSRSCINCHDVHGSSKEHLISDEMTFGKIKMKLNFNKTDNGGSCLPGCHGENIYKR